MAKTNPYLASTKGFVIRRQKGPDYLPNRFGVLAYIFDDKPSAKDQAMTKTRGLRF
jgi:hypothetical protein